MTQHTKQKGFTLIELLVAMGIFAGFIAITGTALVNVLQIQQKTNVLRKVQQDTRQTLESIIREARNTNGVFNGDPYDGGNRIGTPYRVASSSVECLADPIDPGSSVLELYRSDFVQAQVIKKVLYVTTIAGKKTLKMIECARPIANTAGGYSAIPGTGVELSDTNSVVVTQFTAVKTPNDPQAELTSPPMLQIVLATESARGAQAGRVEDRASVSLRSSVTPRSY